MMNIDMKAVTAITKTVREVSRDKVASSRYHDDTLARMNRDTNDTHKEMLKDVILATAPLAAAITCYLKSKAGN